MADHPVEAGKPTKFQPTNPETAMQASEVTKAQGNHTDADYDAFLARIQARFLANIEDGKRPLFTTDAEGLFALYLDGFRAEHRQHHTCSACRQFAERFGHLATIADDGSIAPAIWNEDDAPDGYKAPIAAMARAVRRAKVTGPFLSSEATWGLPITGPWRHMAVKPNAGMLYGRTVLTAGQAMAEKREDFKTVMHALNEFTQPMIEQALTLLRAEALYRSEKVLGQAQWLYDLHVARTAANGNARANVVWKAIATAPAGFCHPRSSMIGTLLEDIAAGLDFSEVSRRFASKMHPLQYQRPQAAPAAGNIAQAEKMFEQLGLAPALPRRIARLEEIAKLWEPRATKEASQPSGAGVFGHLQPKGAAAPAPGLAIPAITMTVSKFVATVVSNADQIELALPDASVAFIALTTAVNADAPPIMQWDRAESRNPFAWYVWHGGSRPASFSMAPGWCKIAAITRLPSRWNEAKSDHHGDGLILVIEGARETREAGLALFPEHLRSELHGVRATIEAHSKSGKMQGMAEGSAVGYDLRAKSGSGYPARLRVTSGGVVQEYSLDRWD